MKILKKELDLEFIKKWREKGVHPILLSIISRRKKTTDNDLIDYFSPCFENILSPFLFQDIVKAYQRIDQAILKNEKIILFGDKDVDGTTAITLLVDFLKEKKADIDWDLPVENEPYGLFMDKVKQWTQKYQLCITVDCGITNNKEIQVLNDHQIDTIIIDHHQPLAKLPAAYAIINPNCENNSIEHNSSACALTFLFILGYLIYKNSLYNQSIACCYHDKNGLKALIYHNFILKQKISSPNIRELKKNTDYCFYYLNQSPPANLKKELIQSNYHFLKKNQAPDFLSLLDQPEIAAKIALFQYLFKQISRLETYKERYLPLVMLSLIADVMPLTHYNRNLAFMGLKYFQKQLPPHLSELCRKLKLEHQTLSSIDIAWKICPLLNSPGRLGNAGITVQFLLGQEHDFYLDQLIAYNNQRKQKSDEAYSSFFPRIASEKRKYNNQLIFFHSDKILKGITGITATKISEDGQCPAIIVAHEGDYYIGSIRGKTQFHFVEFLDKASPLLLEYGGHKQAAGFRFHEKNLAPFMLFLKDNSHCFKDIDQDESIVIDAEIPFDYLNFRLLSLIRLLEPFGKENENPVFLTCRIKIKQYQMIGKNKQHIKLFFESQAELISAIYWNNAENFIKTYDDANQYDMIYQIEFNSYYGNHYPYLNILELKEQGIFQLNQQ